MSLRHPVSHVHVCVYVCVCEKSPVSPLPSHRFHLQSKTSDSSISHIHVCACVYVRACAREKSLIIYLHQRALHLNTFFFFKAQHSPKTALHIYQSEPFISTKEPYILTKEPYILKKKTHITGRLLQKEPYVARPIFTCVTDLTKRALYPHKRALYLHKRALHPHKRALCYTSNIHVCRRPHF